MKDIELGDTIYFFSEINGKTKLLSDEVRGVFTTEAGTFYSRSSNPHNFAIFILNSKDRQLFKSKEEAHQAVNANLEYGEGTMKAE